MSVISRLLDNPVLTKEMRVRMRGARAYWILTGYLGFLSIILFIRYIDWWNSSERSLGSKVGQDFFLWISITQAFLVFFITPAVTSGAITLEKEQRTMEMLQMTRLSRGSIVAGKLLSAVGFVSLLLISSLPLISICFFLGGVSPGQILYYYALMIAGSFATGALGIVWSTVARTTSAAVILTYVSLLLPPFLLYLTAILASLGNLSGARSVEGMLVLALILGLYGVPNSFPEHGVYAMGSFSRHWDMRHFYGLALPPWLGPTLTFLLLGLVLSAVAAARLENVPERKAPLLRSLLVLCFVQQLFFYFGARFFVYSHIAPPGLDAALASLPLLGMLAYPIVLLLFCIPVFSTGEIRSEEARRWGRYLASGWKRAAWQRVTLASGLPFLWLLTAVVIGMFALSYLFIGQPGRIIDGNPIVSGVGSRLVGALPSGGLAPLTVSLLAMVLGLSAVGLFFSALTRNRWAAVGASSVFLFGILVVPAIALLNYNSDANHGPPNILINLFYLNPLYCLAELTDTTGYFQQVPMILSGTPSWLVMTIGYLLMTVVALLLAQPFLAHIAAGPSRRSGDGSETPRPSLPFSERKSALKSILGRRR